MGAEGMGWFWKPLLNKIGRGEKGVRERMRVPMEKVRVRNTTSYREGGLHLETLIQQSKQMKDTIRATQIWNTVFCFSVICVCLEVLEVGGVG